MVSRIVKENAISGTVFFKTLPLASNKKTDRDKHAEHPQPAGNQRNADGGGYVHQFGEGMYPGQVSPSYLQKD